MTELLIELRSNDSKIEEIENEKRIPLSNVTNGLKTRLKDCEKELNGPKLTPERKRVLESQIIDIKKDIRFNEEQIHSMYDKKKIVVHKDSFNKILKYLEKTKKEVSDLISKNESELLEIKNRISKANDVNNFQEVKELSENAEDLYRMLTQNKQILNEINKLMDDIKGTLDIIEELNYEGIDAILRGYRSRVMEIGILLRNTSPVQTMPSNNTPLPNPVLKEKIEKINELLNKAENNLDEEALNKAKELINELDNSEEKNKLKTKAEEIEKKIYLLKLKKINELLDKAEKDLDYEALEEACKLIKTLPEGEEKDKLTKRAHDILEKIKANNEKIEKARKAVEKAEAMGNKYPVEKGAKQAIKEAYDEVNLLDDCQVKTSLLERLDNLVIDMSKKFMEELERLQNKVYEYFVSEEDYKYKSEAEDISEQEITNLKDLYAELYKDEIKEINFTKNGELGCGIKLNYLIFEYNSQAQAYYQQNKVFEKTGKKGTKIKLPFSLKQRLIEARPHFIADAVKKGYKYKIVRDNKKLEKYKSEDYKKARKDKKIEKYEKKYQKDLQAIREHDEICNVPLMVNRNKLEKLKETLYKKGALGLNEKQSKKYQKSVNGISKILLKGLTKITKDKEITSDPLRAKTVIDQYLELLCVAPEKAKLKLKWYKKKEEVPVFEKTMADAIKFIRDSYNEGAITKEDEDSYMFMIGNIKFYRDFNNFSIYEMYSDKDANENEFYTDINDAKKYYENPVTDEKNKMIENIIYILPKRK